MKKFQLYFLAVACCLFVLNSCSKEDVTISEDPSSVEDALRKGNSPAASGQGTIDFGAENKRHFSFQAKMLKDGSVKGSGQLTYTSGELKVKFSIDCITVTGNIAILSGNIISNSNNPEYAGSACRFSVMDNGEGKNADPDLMTPMQTFPGLESIACDYNGVGFLEVLEGNIQVNE